MDRFTVITSGHLTKNHRFPKFMWHTATFIVKFLHVSGRKRDSAMLVENSIRNSLMSNPKGHLFFHFYYENIQ